MTPSEFAVETIELDLPPLVGAFGRRLHEAGVPVSPERAARFAQALTLVKPIARRRLYWTARSVFVSDPAQVSAFDAVFAEVFAAPGLAAAVPFADVLEAPPAPDRTPESPRRAQPSEIAPADMWSSGSSPAPSGPRRRERRDDHAVPVAAVASDEEAIRAKRFDALAPDELATLYRLMEDLALATPRRRTRRHERAHHGARIDLRRSLRASLRTGGDPIRLARRRRRITARRLVLLCDISGSMEPYARAYLQFLTCAAGAGSSAEVFTFATRLTRLTRALHAQRPDRAIQRAAATAPDWSSGTRIADALKTFNDRHGRQGDGPGRGRGHPLRRLGAGRPGLGRPGDGAVVAVGLPDRLGQPSRRCQRLFATGGRHGGGAAVLRRPGQRA